jgi:hypothetical protein
MPFRQPGSSRLFSWMVREASGLSGCAHAHVQAMQHGFSLEIDPGLIQRDIIDIVMAESALFRRWVK